MEASGGAEETFITSPTPPKPPATALDRMVATAVSTPAVTLAFSRPPTGRAPPVDPLAAKAPRESEEESCIAATAPSSDPAVVELKGRGEGMAVVAVVAVVVEVVAPLLPPPEDKREVRD